MRAPSSRQVSERMSKILPRLAEFAGRELSEADVLRLLSIVVAATHRSVRLTPEQAGAAYSTVEHLVGRASTIEMLCANVTRLVANWHFVREGMAVPEWDGSPTEADVLFVCLDRKLIKLPGGQLGRNAKIKLKTGLGAGIITCCALFKRSTELFLEHESGAASLSCPFEEIAGMEARTMVRLNQDGTCSLGRLSTTDAQRKHNRDLAMRRSDPARCGRGVPCNICRLDIMQCPLAIWNTSQGGSDG